MTDITKARKFDWVAYASEKEKEYAKDAKDWHNRGYKEMALVYAGRCMALQQMLEDGGFPECIKGKKL